MNGILRIRLNDAKYFYRTSAIDFVLFTYLKEFYVHNIVPKTQMKKNCENTEDK